MMPIAFTVAGNAVPKQSFRYAKGGGYQPARVKAWQEQVAWAARQAYHGAPLTQPLRLTLIFQLTHKRRVDWDNIAKGTVDSLHNIIFEDDAQIVDAHVIKWQGSPTGETHIYVETITKEGLLCKIQALLATLWSGAPRCTPSSPVVSAAKRSR